MLVIWQIQETLIPNDCLKMNILLVNPWQDTNFPQPPLGLAMIAAVLEKKGYRVKILDLNALDLSQISISNFILKEAPDIIGLTAMTPNINSAIKLARQVKKINDKILIFLGGTHATLLPIETLKFVPEIDIVVHRGRKIAPAAALLRPVFDPRVEPVRRVEAFIVVGVDQVFFSVRRLGPAVFGCLNDMGPRRFSGSFSRS
jgi:hypothetical protein